MARYDTEFDELGLGIELYVNEGKGVVAVCPGFGIVEKFDTVDEAMTSLTKRILDNLRLTMGSGLVGDEEALASWLYSQGKVRIH